MMKTHLHDPARTTPVGGLWGANCGGVNCGEPVKFCEFPCIVARATVARDAYDPRPARPHRTDRSPRMGLPIFIEKVEETRKYLLYAFGPPDEAAGRVRLYTSSGDIELVSLSNLSDGPDTRYYLAQVVPRLQSYHDRAAYPDTDAWEA